MDTNQDAANDLVALVVKMLSTSYTHKDINDIVREAVLNEAEKHPSRRVLYNATYGGFGFSNHFEKYLAKNPVTKDTVNRVPFRERSAQAIADFGREICTKFPFILEDLKTSEKWKLEDLISSRVVAEKLTSDLTMRLASFHASGSPPYSNRDTLFIDHVETHPDTWMLYPRLPFVGRSPRNPWIAARFAHQLLHDAPETYRDQSTGDIDVQLYESIGLAAASNEYSALRLATVPAMVDYTINEYDGSESVEF